MLWNTVSILTDMPKVKLEFDVNSEISFELPYSIDIENN